MLTYLIYKLTITSVLPLSRLVTIIIKITVNGGNHAYSTRMLLALYCLLDTTKICVLILLQIIITLYYPIKYILILYNLIIVPRGLSLSFIDNV